MLRAIVSSAPDPLACRRWCTPNGYKMPSASLDPAIQQRRTKASAWFVAHTWRWQALTGPSREAGVDERQALTPLERRPTACARQPAVATGLACCVASRGEERRVWGV